MKTDVFCHPRKSVKERALLEREDISAKSKKPLQAFLRMERIAAEAKAQGRELGEVKRRIDGKGIVIFTLPGGSSIRDSGREIFYSAHDEEARGIALVYAGLKWGRNIAMEKGRILFHRELEPKLSKRQQGLLR
jgi:hypothetical protein